MLTINSYSKIDTNLKNRPGRIFYSFDYAGLTETEIAQFCEDRLHDQSQIDNICKLSLLFDRFNFDMLKGLVEEMNRYGESPAQASEGVVVGACCWLTSLMGIDFRLQDGKIGQVPVLLLMVQTIAHHKDIRKIEAYIVQR